MQVLRLHYGTINGMLGPATPFNGYAIVHPQGVVLVDTGFGRAFGDGDEGALVSAGRPPMHWVRRSTIDALADHAIHPSDVTHVINTHLGDHSGENAVFRHAQFVIQAPEVAFAAKKYPHVRDQWEFAGVRADYLQGEDVEVLAGITCLFTPGHTPGHQSILVADDETSRKTLFVGDAVYTADIWEDLDVIDESHPAWGAQFNLGIGREIWQASARKLRAVDADVLHFAHDAKIVHRRR